MASHSITPNFFLDGAPKSGATALGGYLRGHPNIFLSRPKEPHYFAEDLTHFRTAATMNEYLSLFGNQLERLLAVIPGSQVKSIIYDDFIRNPGAVYRAVLGFFGLCAAGRRGIEKVNPSKTHRWERLGALLMHSPILLRTLWNVLKKICGPGISRLSEGLIRPGHFPLEPTWIRDSPMTIGVFSDASCDHRALERSANVATNHPVDSHEIV